MMAYQRLLSDNRFLKSYTPSANSAPLSWNHSSSYFPCQSKAATLSFARRPSRMHCCCNHSFLDPTRQSKVAALSFARRPSRMHCCCNHSFLDPTWDVTYKKPLKTESETDLEFSSIGMKTDVDWLNLTHEEFEEHLNKLRQRVPNFSPAMLCEEERNKFWLRRNIAAAKLAKEFSDMVGNNDLLTPLEELRRTKGGDCLMEESINAADQQCNNLPDEKFAESEIEETARHMMLSKHSVPIFGLPIFYVEKKSILRVKPWSKVALDTNIWLSNGQLNVDNFQSNAVAVRNLLDLPLNFVAGATSFTEVTSVIMRENVKVKELVTVVKWHARMKLQIQFWIVAACRSFLIALVKRISNQYIKNCLRWIDVMHTENVKAKKLASRNIGHVNRQIRLATIEKVFKFMDLYFMAEYERGRASHYEDVQVMKDAPFAVQAYDSQLVRQCVDAFCHVFATLDKGLKHGRSLVCTKDGMRRRMLLWNLSIEPWEEPGL